MNPLAITVGVMLIAAGLLGSAIAWSALPRGLVGFLLAVALVVWGVVVIVRSVRNNGTAPPADKN